MVDTTYTHQHRRPDNRAADCRSQTPPMFQHLRGQGLSRASVKRPALSRCLKTLRASDTLIVWKLDRMGRSLRDLITILDDLRARGVKFHSLTRQSTLRRPEAPHVADDRRAGGARKKPYLRMHSRRSEGRAAPRREVWPEAEPDTRADLTLGS